MVAQNHPVKLAKLKKWSEKEGMKNKYEVFLQNLKES